MSRASPEALAARCRPRALGSGRERKEEGLVAVGGWWKEDDSRGAEGGEAEYRYNVEGQEEEEIMEKAEGELRKRWDNSAAGEVEMVE